MEQELEREGIASVCSASMSRRTRQYLINVRSGAKKTKKADNCSEILEKDLFLQLTIIYKNVKKVSSRVSEGAESKYISGTVWRTLPVENIV